VLFRSDHSSFTGAVALADPTILFTQNDGAIVADPLSFVDPDAQRLAAGENLGGLTFEACP
jgi:hypothetical protein